MAEFLELATFNSTHRKAQITSKNNDTKDNSEEALGRWKVQIQGDPPESSGAFYGLFNIWEMAR